MIAAIQSLIQKHLPAAAESRADLESTLRAAAATLLLEVASADDHISREEREAVVRIISEAYGLSAVQARKISADAEKRAGSVTSLYPFTRLLTRECSMEERVEIVRRLWQVAFVDGRVDAHEEHLIRKVADLLYVPHSQFIRAKISQSGATD
jgi:uncharacterized tellurite resistance protein B-like protein